MYDCNLPAILKKIFTDSDSVDELVELRGSAVDLIQGAGLRGTDPCSRVIVTLLN